MEYNNWEQDGIKPEESVENQPEAKSFKKPTIAQVSILYSVSVILFIFLSRVLGRIPFGDYYVKGIVSEVLLVMVPPLAFLFLLRLDIKKVLRLNRIKFKNLFLIFWIMVFAIPAVSALNMVNMLVIKYLFGKTSVSSIPDISNTLDLIKGIIVIGLSAAVCEEILFRGAIQRGFEKLGAIKSIILTAFLFGLMHQDFQKLLGTFLLGCIIGFIVYRSDSIIGGMFAHFTNNSLLVLLSFGISKIPKLANPSGVGGEYDTDRYLAGLINGSKAELMAFLFVWAIIFLFFITAFSGIMYAFIKNTSNNKNRVLPEKGRNNLLGLLWLLPGLLLIGLIYLGQGVALKGIKIEEISALLKFLGI